MKRDACISQYVPSSGIHYSIVKLTGMHKQSSALSFVFVSYTTPWNLWIWQVGLESVSFTRSKSLSYTCEETGDERLGVLPEKTNVHRKSVGFLSKLEGRQPTHLQLEDANILQHLNHYDSQLWWLHLPVNGREMGLFWERVKLKGCYGRVSMDEM